LDNDVTRGNLCVKGRFGFEYVHAQDEKHEEHEGHEDREGR
jgi:predicted molibdopterin-dependent oxidoreductase YjgC